MMKHESLEAVHTHTHTHTHTHLSLYKRRENILRESNKGITLIALVVTIIFSYDEKLKCSNSKGFLLQTI